MSASRDERHSGPQWESLIRNGALIAAVLAALWLAFNVRLPSTETMQAWFQGAGWASGFAFIGLYALVAMTPIPVTIMAVAGGLLFGVAYGSLLSVVGALLGGWAAYWLARVLGRETVMKLLGSHAAKVQTNLEGAGFQAVSMLRLLPGFPYWPVNYGSGAFGVSQRDFVLASAIATLPGQVSLVAIGAFVAHPDVFHGVVIGVAWAIVAAATVWAFVAWRKARGHTKPAADQPE